jgi:glycosyl hydrolase family 42 (putative beta-galactosidase)
MKTTLVLALILIAFTGAPTMHAGAQVPRFQQDRFAIGFWVDPPVDGSVDARYAEIAGAHFNLAIAIFGATTAKEQERILALCEKHGLKAILAHRGGSLEEPVDGPACWGYSLRDEPSVTDFPELRTRVDALRAAEPGRLAYINLFPSYASPWGQLGAETYDEYVRRFMEVVDVDVLSMDHYPRFGPQVDGRDPYCEDLAVMREYALEYGIPFWNFFNTMPYGPHTDPTEGQLRWQVYASLAHGARGILYFCYFTPPGAEFPKGGAIINRDGTRTRHYDQACRINSAVSHLGPTLMQLTSTGVYRIGPEDDPADVLAGTPLRTIVRADVDPPHDYQVGVFSHADGRRAVLLQNYRYAFTAWPTVEFDADPDQVAEVSQATGEEIPLRDDSPDMEGLQISLDSGEGRLFLLPAR